jgi:hypothetical protein
MSLFALVIGLVAVSAFVAVPLLSKSMRRVTESMSSGGASRSFRAS